MRRHISLFDLCCQRNDQKNIGIKITVIVLDNNGRSDATLLGTAVRIQIHHVDIPALVHPVCGHVQLTGPNYESPSEVKMCRLIGGDAVGMSTACEAIAANHMGMKVCGISCITNMASGISKVPLSHIEVKETADRVAPLFKNLVTESIVRIAAAL